MHKKCCWEGHWEQSESCPISHLLPEGVLAPLGEYQLAGVMPPPPEEIPENCGEAVKKLAFLAAKCRDDAAALTALLHVAESLLDAQLAFGAAEEKGLVGMVFALANARDHAAEKD